MIATARATLHEKCIQTVSVSIILLGCGRPEAFQQLLAHDNFVEKLMTMAASHKNQQDSNEANDVHQ